MDIPYVRTFVALGLSFAIWFVFKNMKAISQNSFLTFLGRHSLEIYILHEFAGAPIRLILLKLGFTNAYISLTITVFALVALPLLFSFITNKMGLYDLFFKPMNYIDKIKGK